MQTAIHQSKVGDILLLEHEHLQNRNFILVSDSLEIESICMDLGSDYEAVSGLLVWAADGDYVEVWSTTWRAPYLLTAQYERVS